MLLLVQSISRILTNCIRLLASGIKVLKAMAGAPHRSPEIFMNPCQGLPLFSICTLLLGTIALNSCKGHPKSADAGKQGAGVDRMDGAISETTSLSRETAGQTIDYTNKIVDFLNDSSDTMQRNQRTIGQLAGNLKEADERGDFQWIRDSTIIGVSVPSPGGLDVIPGNFGSKDRTYFQEHITTMADAMESVKNDLQTYSGYLNHQDYKDDKGAKAHQLLDRMVQKNDAFWAAHKETGIKVHEISDEVEILALQGHPLREHIVAMKEDMKTSGEMLAVLTSKDCATNDPTSKDAVQGNFKGIAVAAKECYAKLERAREEHSAINPEALEKAGETSRYKEFYSAMSDFVGSARKNIRFGEEKSYLLEDYLTELNRKRDSMISAYNQFAN
ncbi:MAG: hypothetical protein QM755_06305 [Luteolibacter sp.]